MDKKKFSTSLCFKCKIRASVSQGFCLDCLMETADVKINKIEIRQDCKECGEDIINARFRTFCSKKCRLKFHNGKRRAYQADWIKKKRKKLKELGVLTPTLVRVK